MGINVDRERFEARDFEAFNLRLRCSLDALFQLLQRPDFGRGPCSLGAELELSLIDPQGCALPLARDVLREAIDPHLQLELDRFNLEYNLTPVAAAGTPFSALEREMREAIERLDVLASAHGGAVVPIGILPSLTAGDLTRHSMSDLPRYRALSHALRALRGGEPFVVCIDGADPLRVEVDDVTMEGAATSLQVHLRVDPEDFADVYNAAQLATAPVLAVSGNSPSFLGHRLWAETRIALFKQAVDTRAQEFRRPPRVCFGHGWVRRGAHELFAEAVGLFPPLLPICGDEDPMSQLRADRLPALGELRLHAGTVWRWNRPVYDPNDSGHLRIELRALPAGPTPLDCAANAAFLVGLSLGLRDRVSQLLPVFPFEHCQWNFYRAAQGGLDAQLLWPDGADAPGYRLRPVRELLPQLLDVASHGLSLLGVDDREAERLLAVIAERTRSGRTGAAWQLEQLARLEPRRGRREALLELTRGYTTNSKGGLPVHQWGDLR